MSVPKEFKGHVIGKGGQVIKEIRKRSGASITSASKEEEGFTVNGNAEEIKSAKRLILEKVVSCKKERFNKQPPQYLNKVHKQYKEVSASPASGGGGVLDQWLGIGVPLRVSNPDPV